MSIAAIKAAVSLPELIGEYVKLRLVGTEHTGLCPFHSERTPSLRVHADYFKCFGCGAGGDCFTFVSMIEAVSLGRAMARLSERTGIPLDGKRRTPIQRAGDRQDLDFALWWHGRQVRRLSRQLTAYVIHAEDEADELGTLLRQLRSLDRQAIVGAARRLGTAQDWKEWGRLKAEQRWFENFWMSLATLPHGYIEAPNIDHSLDPFEIVRRFGGTFYRSLVDDAITVPNYE